VVVVVVVAVAASVAVVAVVAVVVLKLSTCGHRQESAAGRGLSVVPPAAARKRGSVGRPRALRADLKTPPINRINRINAMNHRINKFDFTVCLFNNVYTFIKTFILDPEWRVL
jgi:hypothetical protein